MPINDSGSNYQFADKLEKPSVPKSLFDLSCLSDMTIPKEGMIIPIKLFETLPGDTWDIDVSCLLRVMPQVVPLYSRQRIFIHAYYSRYQELWNDAETFVTKGYTGKENIVRPAISANNFDSTLLSGTVEPESLADYFGLPIGASYSDLSTAGVSALPFMMYERIYRDYYMNKNYYTTSRQWLPNDDGDLRLNTNGEIISTVGAGAKEITFGNLHYRDWTADYFTSALPWPQRGDEAFISAGDATVSGFVNIPALAVESPSDVPDRFVPTSLFRQNGTSMSPFADAKSVALFDSSSSDIGYVLRGSDGYSNSGSFSSYTIRDPSSGSTSNINPFYLGFSTDSLNNKMNTVPQVAGFSSSGALSVSISAEDFRVLFVNQSIMEKMARTDGSYTEFGYAFFGVSSKASRTFRPTYIGGTYQPIVFTEVLQNSQTTAQSPLGAQAGHGISSTPKGMSNIGRCFSDDFGYIMIVVSIMPDTFYSQGLERMWTRSTQADMYLPERAKLGMQPILNRELFFSGAEVQDSNVWAYQNRYDEYRYSPNSVHGKLADPSSLSFFPYTQSRYFSSLPGYSQDFARADDVRDDVFFAGGESHYSAQFAIRARVARPLPYKAIPAQVI